MCSLAFHHSREQSFEAKVERGVCSVFHWLSSLEAGIETGLCRVFFASQHLRQGKRREFAVSSFTFHNAREQSLVAGIERTVCSVFLCRESS